MLHGTENKVDDLLSKLFAEDLDSAPPPPSRPDERGKNDEETDFLIQKAKEGSEEAFSLLHEKFHNRVMAAIRDQNFGGLTVPHQDIENFAQDVWRSLFKMIKTYDPNRAPFGGWVYSTTKNFAQKFYDRFVKGAEKRGRELHPDYEKDIKAKDVAPNDFEAEEREFWEKELKPHLEAMASGKVPLPYRSVGLKMPGESRQEADARNQKYHVDIFMKKHGLGVPFMNNVDIAVDFIRGLWENGTPEQRIWLLTDLNKFGVPREVAEKYADKSFDEIMKTKMDPASGVDLSHALFPQIGNPKYHFSELNRFERLMKAGLRQWANERGKGKFFDDLINKAHRMVATKSGAHRAHMSGTSSVIEQHLLELLDILEGWNAADAC